MLGGVRLGDAPSIGPRDRVVLGALVVRRGEVVTAEALADGEVVRYLNRLADLVFVLARYEEGDFRTLRTG